MVWDEGEFTEGPTPAADGAILFSDIGDRIMRFDTATGRTTVYRAPSGKSNGLEFNAAGLLVACEGAGPGGKRRISITDKLGRVKTLTSHYDNKRYNSPNDLAIAANGNVYFTDPRYVGEDPRELNFEGVFVVDPKGRVHVATRNVEKPNGIIVTPDGKTVYVSDNNNLPDGKHQLVAFAVQPDGTLDDKGILYDFGPNKRGIDGMTLDVEGNIYAAAGRGAGGNLRVLSAGQAPGVHPHAGRPDQLHLWHWPPVEHAVHHRGHAAAGRRRDSSAVRAVSHGA